MTRTHNKLSLRHLMLALCVIESISQAYAQQMTSNFEADMGLISSALLTTPGATSANNVSAGHVNMEQLNRL